MDICFKNLYKKILTIKEFIYTTVYSLTDIRYRVGEQRGAEQPQFDDSDWVTFNIGQFWGGKDVMCWFRIPFQVPKKYHQRKLALIIQPGKRFMFKGSEGGDLR